MPISNTAFALNLLVLTIDVLIWLINISISIILCHYFCTKQLQNETKVTLWIYTYIHLTLVALISIIITYHIEIYINDIYENNTKSTVCIFWGFIFYIALNMFILSLVNQALFRLCRVVYSTRQSFRTLRIYIILPIFDLILSIILLSPLLFTNSIVYFSIDNNCVVEFTNTFAIFWTGLIIYIIPIIIIALLYWKIISFIRNQLTNQTITIKQRQKRELPVIRRLFIIIAITAISEIPAFTFVFVIFFTRAEFDFRYRLFWLLMNLGLLGSSIFIIILTPEIKTIIWNKFQRNRIQPNVIQIRHVF